MQLKCKIFRSVKNVSKKATTTSVIKTAENFISFFLFKNFLATTGTLLLTVKIRFEVENPLNGVDWCVCRKKNHNPFCHLIIHMNFTIWEQKHKKIFSIPIFNFFFTNRYVVCNFFFQIFFAR